MSEVNKQDKQNINNIKALYKLVADNQLPNLFREVKKIRNDLLNLEKSFFDQVREDKRKQEEKQKLEQLKAQMTTKKEESSQSFAELFAKANGEEIKEKKEESAQKVETLEVKPQEKRIENVKVEANKMPNPKQNQLSQKTSVKNNLANKP